MTKLLAVSGKGGVGKTSLSALAVRALVKRGLGPILLIDADPNSNLGEAMGVKVDKTIGTMRQEFFDAKGAVPAGMSKETILEMRLNEVLIETKHFDLMVMGRQEGTGCYCFINNVLRNYGDKLAANYPYIIVDNEAGMEHLSRRTTAKIDTMWVVSDHSIKGARAVVRINELIDELKLPVGRRFAIANRAPDDLEPNFTNLLEQSGLPLAGSIPQDPIVQKFDMSMESFLNIPDDSVAAKRVDAMLEKTFLKA